MYNWGKRNIKKQARFDTIISEYQRIFNCDNIGDKQYWTMCSRCTDDNGKPQEGSEYDQTINSGLLLPNRWNGVDKDAAFIRDNKQAYPTANWYAGDFYWTMREAWSNDAFHPAIVNIDTMVMGPRAAPFVADILDLCSELDNIMVVINIVTEEPRRHRKIPMSTFLDLLGKEPKFRHSERNAKWQFDEEKYLYKKHSEMGTIILYKKPLDIVEV